MSPSWTIEPVTPSTLEEVVSFINNARRDMFPELCAQLKDDVAHWVSRGFFLTAIAEEGGNKGRVIATIGYVPYDQRFPQPQLDYKEKGKKTVEVVRLYVLPAWRRRGVAKELFARLREKAVGEGVEVLYLHTHPFLAGAVGFWERCGFRVVDVEEDGVWRTTHMELVLNEREA